MQYHNVKLNPRSINPNLEVLCYKLFMDTLENGTEAEQRVKYTAFRSIQKQQKTVEIDECLSLPGFDKGLCDCLHDIVADIGTLYQHITAMLQEMAQNLPPVLLNESDNDPDAHQSLGFACRYLAGVKVFERHFEGFYRYKMVFPSVRDDVPLEINVEVNEEEVMFTRKLN